MPQADPATTLHRFRINAEQLVRAVDARDAERAGRYGHAAINLAAQVKDAMQRIPHDLLPLDERREVIGIVEAFAKPAEDARCLAEGTGAALGEVLIEQDESWGWMPVDWKRPLERLRALAEDVRRGVESAPQAAAADADRSEPSDAEAPPPALTDTDERILIAMLGFDWDRPQSARSIADATEDPESPTTNPALSDRTVRDRISERLEPAGYVEKPKGHGGKYRLTTRGRKRAGGLKLNH